MIKWYYKIKRVLMPILIVIIVALFILVPLSFYFTSKSNDEKKKIDAPKLVLENALVETEIDDGVNDPNTFEDDTDRISSWDWKFDLSNFDGYEITDYYVIAKKKDFNDGNSDTYDDFYNDMLSPDNSKQLIWTYDHTTTDTNVSKILDSWKHSLVFEYILPSSIEYEDWQEEQAATFLNGVYKPWDNENSVFEIENLPSSSLGYDLDAAISVNGVNEEGLEIMFNDIRLDDTPIITAPSTNLGYISMPKITYLYSELGILDGVFYNVKNSSQLKVNPYEFSINPQIDVYNGKNANMQDVYYEIPPTVSARLYYDKNPTDYIINGDSAYDSNEDTIIAELNNSRQTIVNGEYVFNFGVLPMLSSAYKNNVIKETINPNNFRIDLSFSFKFNSLSFIKQSLGVEKVISDKGEDSDEFDWIDDYENPNLYNETYNNLKVDSKTDTSDGMESILEFMKLQLVPASFSVVLNKTKSGLMQLSLVTKDDFFFNSPSVNRSELMFNIDITWYSNSGGIGDKKTKWFSMGDFVDYNINGETYHVSTTMFNNMFSDDELYFIDPDSYFSFSISDDDINFSSDFSPTYGQDKIVQYFDPNIFKLVNYENQSEIFNLIPNKDSNEYKVIAPDNFHYRDISHEMNDNYMLIVIIMLILVFIIPVIFIVIYRFARRFYRK